MRQVWSEDDNEVYEMDPETGSVWITDKKTGEVHAQQGDPALMGTSDMPAIPNYPEPQAQQTPKSVGVDDMLAREGAYRQANGMAPDAPLSDQDIANLTGTAFAATRFGADNHPAGQTNIRPDPTKAAAPLKSSQTFPINPAAAVPHRGFASQPPGPVPPGGVPLPPPPGTPGVGVGAVETVQMPGGRDVQVTAPGGPEVTVGGKRVTPPGGVPVAETAGPGEPLSTVSPERVVPKPASPPAIDPTKGVKPPTKNFQPEAPGPEVPKGPTREELIQQALDELRAEPEREIDMDRWWNSRTGAQKVAAIGAGIADGFLKGFRGVSIGANESFDAARQGDIAAQRADIDRGTTRRSDVLKSLMDELAIMQRDAAAEAKAGAAKKYPNMPASMVEKGALVTQLARSANRLTQSYAALPVGSGLEAAVSPLESQGSQYDADRAAYIAQVVLMLSGKQSNEREQKRLEAMIPTSFWPPTTAKGLQLWKASVEWVEDQRRALDEAAMRIYGQPATSLSPDEHEALAAAIIPDEIPGFVAEIAGDPEEAPAEDY